MSGPEPERYTATEAMQLASIVAQGVAGGSRARIGRRIEDIKAKAVARETAERTAREKREAKRRQELADRKARRFW